ncbi:MAG TPA: hypothetical protein VMW67_03195 [Desulfobacteria bacterium]|nr:hypothetical protein [Desulfobacteria bacterium]
MVTDRSLGSIASSPNGKCEITRSRYGTARPRLGAIGKKERIEKLDVMDFF